MKSSIENTPNGPAAAAAKSLQSCLTLCDSIGGSPKGSPRPWDSSDKNTGVSYHFLLQCMKMKSESEAAQSCPTLSNPMDCSLPGSCIHRIFQARVLEWGPIAFSEKPSSNSQRSLLFPFLFASLSILAMAIFHPTKITFFTHQKTRGTCRVTTALQ